MKCPNCNSKITSKHYDPEYEIYECPGCGEAYEADDLEEAQNGTSPRKRRELSSGPKPAAKGKKRQAQISEDAEALARYEQAQLKPKKADKSIKHRDEIATGQILEIVADEIEAIWQEFGSTIDRLNAREYFAMNIIRPLRLDGVAFREKEIPAVYCKEHK